MKSEAAGEQCRACGGLGYYLDPQCMHPRTNPCAHAGRKQKKQMQDEETGKVTTVYKRERVMDCPPRPCRACPAGRRMCEALRAKVREQEERIREMEQLGFGRGEGF